MDASAPEKFGKYLLLDKIATGGMAELFRAKLTGAEGFEKLLAIKKILHHLNSEDKLVNAFIGEAKLAAYLHHPNIVQIFDFGCMNDTYYIAMEYLFGKDLRYTIKRTLERGIPIQLDHALFIVTQLLTGLDYAHTLNDFSGNPLCIIHRDIGPQNIFITYNGQVKIIDFGIAKAATQDANTQVGTIKGKVSYMSPEQAGGEIIDHRSDIFSAGIVFYELVTGKKMYEGDTFQVLAKARDAMFKPAEYIKSDLPKDVYRIIDKALSKFPDDRYQTAEDMCRDIDMFMMDKGMRVTQRDLASFMKALFEGESDEHDIGKNMSSESKKRPNEDEETLITESKEKTRIDPTRRRGRGEKYSLPRVAFFTLAFAATLFVYYFAQSEQGGHLINRAMDSLINKRIMLNIAHNNEAIKIAKQTLEDGNYDEAIEKYDDILSDSPSSINYISADYSKALTLKASNLIGIDINKAKAYLDTAYGLYPKNSETCFLLGKVYTQMKQNRKALDYYEKAAQIDPENPDIYFNMGYNCAVLDDYGKAQEMFKKVIALSPIFLDQAYFNLGLIQEKTGKHNEAVENMKMALKVNPKNINAKKFLKNIKLSQNN